MPDPQQNPAAFDVVSQPPAAGRNIWSSGIPVGGRAALFFGLGLAALVLTIAASWHLQSQAKPLPVSVSTPAHSGMKDRLVRSVVAESQAHRLQIEHVAILDIGETIRRLEDHTLTFAVIPGGFDLTAHDELRQVAALNIEPLQLVVKEEIHAEIQQSLYNLKGRRVQLGTETSTIAHLLGREILTLAGLNVGTETEAGDIIQVQPTPNLVKEPDRERMPDAFFMVSGLPSPTIRELTLKRGYQLIPLPYSKLLRMSAQADGENKAGTENSPRLLKERVTEALIPASTYRIADPAIPPQDVPTLGTRVLIITHRSTNSIAVERLLGALYASRGFRKFDPPLTPSIADEFQELAWHEGAVNYAQRDQPLLTGAMISNVANAIQIMIPALTAVFCVWQWLRQRTRSRRSDDFQVYQGAIIQIESQILDLDEASGNPSRLAELERQLGRLKTEVLSRRGLKSENESAMTSALLLQIHDARTHIDSLISRSTGRVAAAGGIAN